MDLFLSNLYKVTIYQDRWKLYFEGLYNTIIIAVLSCLVGIAIALFISIAKYYYDQKPNKLLGILVKFCNLYITIIRGTPIVIQLLIMYTVVFTTGFQAAVAAFGVNSGAYIAEIIRAGIDSVDIGQTEAGRSLGLNTSQTMIKIILPQATKNILPSLFNELIALLKETAVAGTIAVRDLTKVSDSIRGITFNTYPLFIAGAMYLIMVILLTKVQEKIEKRLKQSDRN